MVSLRSLHCEGVLFPLSRFWLIAGVALFINLLASNLLGSLRRAHAARCAGEIAAERVHVSGVAGGKCWRS
jgi:hypothetical protein